MGLGEAQLGDCKENNTYLLSYPPPPPPVSQYKKPFDKKEIPGNLSLRPSYRMQKPEVTDKVPLLTVRREQYDRVRI